MTNAAVRAEGAGSRSGARFGGWALGLWMLALGMSTGLMLPGGGLGIAGVASLGGVIAITAAFVARMAPRPGWLFAAGAVFVAWSALSFLWSPYPYADYVARYLAGVPLYIAFFVLCAALDGRARRLAAAAAVLGVVSAAFFFVFEALSGAAITVSFRGGAEDMGIVWRNIGNGYSAWVVLAPAAVALVWPGGTRARILVVVIGAASTVAAQRFGLTSNLLGVAAALAAAFAASRAPRATLVAIGALAGLSVIAAPLIGFAAGAAPEGLRDLMPLSWELRLEAWSFAVDRILERPLAGWGFDAARALDAMVEVHGKDFAALPLHPHNGGLHVWLETGLVGAALLTLAIGLATRAAVRGCAHNPARAVAAAAMAAAYASMELVSYGVWQEWWLATFAAGAGAVALVRTPKPEPAVEAQAQAETVAA